MKHHRESGQVRSSRILTGVFRAVCELTCGAESGHVGGTILGSESRPLRCKGNWKRDLGTTHQYPPATGPRKINTGSRLSRNVERIFIIVIKIIVIQNTMPRELVHKHMKKLKVEIVLLLKC